MVVEYIMCTFPKIHWLSLLKASEWEIDANISKLQGIPKHFQNLVRCYLIDGITITFSTLKRYGIEEKYWPQFFISDEDWERHWDSFDQDEYFEEGIKDTSILTEFQPCFYSLIDHDLENEIVVSSSVSNECINENDESLNDIFDQSTIAYEHDASISRPTLNEPTCEHVQNPEIPIVSATSTLLSELREAPTAPIENALENLEEFLRNSLPLHCSQITSDSMKEIRQKLSEIINSTIDVALNEFMFKIRQQLREMLLSKVVKVFDASKVDTEAQMSTPMQSTVQSEQQTFDHINKLSRANAKILDGLENLSGQIKMLNERMNKIQESNSYEMNGIKYNQGIIATSILKLDEYQRHSEVNI